MSVTKKKKDTKGIYCPKCHKRVLRAVYLDTKYVRIYCSCGYKLKEKDMVLTNESIKSV